MIEQATALAETRGWDYEFVSPLHIALMVPLPGFGQSILWKIFCSVDGQAWGFLTLQEFLTYSERSEETRMAIRCLKQFVAPAELDVLSEPDCCIRYALDLDLEEGVENHRGGRAIDDTLVHMDMAWAVLQLVNWGDKSAYEAIAHVSALELQELRSVVTAGTQKNRRPEMAPAQDDFKIPPEKLDELNAAVESTVSEYFKRSPDADPLDGISVTVNFAFGLGRDLDAHAAGKTISVNLD